MTILKVEVPIACFRQSRAREYWETYPVPPPSTVYGMLLSLVGETNRCIHCGVRLAIALTKMPEKSTVLRKTHRFKSKLQDPKNIRPDHQELLTGIEFFVWINSESETANPNLCTRISTAFADPSSIARFGGLSLGESRDLVDSVNLIDTAESLQQSQEPLLWLVQQNAGQLSLPYWVNHLGQQGTLWRRYILQQAAQINPPEDAWTAILSSTVA